MDETKSTYIRILRDGRSAPYTLRDLAPGTYLVAAWKDVNENEEVDDGDYLGVYVDAQGDYLVRPPRSGVDFSLEALVVSRVMCKSLCTGGIPLLKQLLQYLLHLREPL